MTQFVFFKENKIKRYYEIYPLKVIKIGQFDFIKSEVHNIIDDYRHSK